MKPVHAHRPMLVVLLCGLFAASPSASLLDEPKASQSASIQIPQDQAVILRNLAENLQSLRNADPSAGSDVAVLQAALESPAISADVKCRIAQFFQFFPAFHDAEKTTPEPIKDEMANIQAKLQTNLSAGHGDVQSVIVTLLGYQKTEEQKGYRVFARALGAAVAVLNDGANDVYGPSGAIQNAVGERASGNVLIRIAIGATLGGFHSEKIAAVVARQPVSMPILLTGATVGALSYSVVALMPATR